jgi:hypothetical protein
MPPQPLTEPGVLARQLWRDARARGWTSKSLRITIGWLAKSEPQALALRREVLRASEYSPAPDEDYEPEDDPKEVICVRVVPRLTLAKLEQELEWAARLGDQFGARQSRAGLGIA